MNMQKKSFWIGLVLVLTVILKVRGQYAREDSSFKRWFIGSTVFLLGNFSDKNPPDFFQINVGYRITGKDVITLEPKTWKYAWPNA
jgi:hypothetical protein